MYIYVIQCVKMTTVEPTLRPPDNVTPPPTRKTIFESPKKSNSVKFCLNNETSLLIRPFSKQYNVWS